VDVRRRSWTTHTHRRCVTPFDLWVENPCEHQRADIDVTSRRQDSPPKFVEIECEMRLVTDEDERRVDLLHRNLRQFGTVYNTLAAVSTSTAPSSLSLSLSLSLSPCQLARAGDDRKSLRRLLR